MAVGHVPDERSETLDAASLKTWLDTLQAAIPGKLTVVYDACESGTFVGALAAPAGYEDKRLVLTSTSPGELGVLRDAGHGVVLKLFLDADF